MIFPKHAFFYLGIAIAIPFSFLYQPAIADSLTVHEWGTFTTLTTSSGVSLSGLYQDATRLPAFVHGLPFFNYDSIKGWPTPEKLRGVTVKMETPVLYFYSDLERDMDVEVGFKGGTISQWYPERVSGETNPVGSVVDFADAYTGSIRWKAKVLDRGMLPYTSPAALETPEWIAPRRTAANLLLGQGGEIEKFLFYRGLGNFLLPLETHFTPQGALSITNRGPVKISHVMVYECPRGGDPWVGKPSIWWEGELAPSQTVAVTRTLPDMTLASNATERLRAAMVKAGLFDDESRSLLETWAGSYFTVERGLKVFWLVPREEIDKILPLKISPVPGKLERVIVGRSDILTPEFEAELVTAFKADTLEKFQADKYYLAYLDFLRLKGFQYQVATALAKNKKNPVSHHTIPTADRPPWGFWIGSPENLAPFIDISGRSRPVAP